MFNFPNRDEHVHKKTVEHIKILNSKHVVDMQLGHKAGCGIGFQMLASSSPTDVRIAVLLGARARTAVPVHLSRGSACVNIYIFVLVQDLGI